MKRWLYLLGVLVFCLSCVTTKFASPTPTQPAIEPEPPTITVMRPTPTVDETAGGVPDETPAPVDVEAAMSESLNQLSEGQIVFNNPEEMRVGAPEVVEALLTQDTSAEMTEYLEESLEGTGAPQSQAIKVSALMRVRLVPVDARDFKVEPLYTADQEIQLVDAEAATSWSWRVTPLRAGTERKLHLMVTAVVEVPGYGTTERKFPTQTIAISVKVNPAYTIGETLRRYIWVLGLLILLGVGIWAVRAFAAQKAPQAAEQEGYANLTIRIRALTPQGYPVEIECGGRQFPKGYLSSEVTDWITRTSAQSEGARLFNALLADSRVQAAWSEIRGQYPQRRVRLLIDEAAPELHAIPWEILRDTTPGTNAETPAADTDTPFSRYLAGHWRPLTPVSKRPIKMLVVISNPEDLASYDLPALDVRAEEQFLRQALTGVPADYVEITVLPSPVTLSALEAELRNGYHILHFTGHGQYSSRREEAVLILADEQNHAVQVRDAEFADMIMRQDQSLRLVFLASCQTATRSPAAAFRGFAPQLIAAGVPTVLAMQDLIPFTTARRFVRVFYERLFAHGQVDLASNEARSAVMTANLPGGSIPVLFSRLPDNRLFRISKRGDEKAR